MPAIFTQYGFKACFKTCARITSNEEPFILAYLRSCNYLIIPEWPSISPIGSHRPPKCLAKNSSTTA